MQNTRFEVGELVTITAGAYEFSSGRVLEVDTREEFFEYYLLDLGGGRERWYRGDFLTK